MSRAKSREASEAEGRANKRKFDIFRKRSASKKKEAVGREVLLQQNINPNSQVWDVRDYAKYILSNGNSEIKRELFKLFDYQFYLQNKQITTLRAH